MNAPCPLGAEPVDDERPDLIRHAMLRHTNIVLVDWMLGNACNYACSYCPDALHDGSVRWQKPDVIRSMFRSLKRHYADGMGREVWLQFTGGEPTMHPQIVPLLDEAADMGFSVSLISNAGRTRRFWERIIDRLDNVILTYHHEFADHDHFIDIAARLADAMPVHVNVTVHPDRFDEILRRSEVIAEAVPTASFSLKPLRVGFGDQLYNYTEDQLKRLEGRLTHPVRRHAKIPRSVMAFETKSGETEVRRANEFIMSKTNRWKGYICEAGLESLRIHGGGAITRAVCGVGGRIGRLGDPIELPVSPIRCDRTSCSCVADILITKRRLKAPGLA